MPQFKTILALLGLSLLTALILLTPGCKNAATSPQRFTPAKLTTGQAPWFGIQDPDNPGDTYQTGDW